MSKHNMILYDKDTMIRIHLINVINLFIYMFIGPVVMIFIIFEFKKVSTWLYIMNHISYLMYARPPERSGLE